jgi:hypothetical protein
MPNCLLLHSVQFRGRYEFRKEAISLSACERLLIRYAAQVLDPVLVEVLVRLLRSTFLVACAVLFGAPAFAKNDTPFMPSYILSARTVAVIIDSEAGVSMRDPNGNQTARKDVEAALTKWGRLQPVMDPRGADLIIVVRKARKVADVTISDPRQNRRGAVLEPTDDGISVGGQHGPSRPVGQAGNKGKLPVPGGPGETRPTMEAGTPGDVFMVFQAGRDNPSYDVPGWQYVKKDGLHSHDVPAVAAFRKAIAEAEAAQQQHP